MEEQIKIRKPIVAISGGFDVIHAGHIYLLQNAMMSGDVVVILNSDEWLIRKKGYRALDWSARAAIMGQLKGVVAVYSVDDSDNTVCEALERIKPDYFANGGDRNKENTPEKEVCERLGIKMLWGIGGDKVASSQEIINEIR